MVLTHLKKKLVYVLSNYDYVEVYWIWRSEGEEGWFVWLFCSKHQFVDVTLEVIDVMKIILYIAV